MNSEGLMDDISPEEIGRIWPITLPACVHRTALGTNNRSFIVDCNGHTYFLKRYDNAPDHERLLFEHRITAAIAAQRPPFVVPETILSRFGDTHILRDGHYYALSTFVPGSVARYGDLDDAFACGQALAELHTALAQVVDFAPRDEHQRGLYDLATVHPSISVPGRAIEEAIGDAWLADAVTVILATIQSRCAAGTAGWPLTWIHWDFYPSNVLLRSHRVSGIVDFEFAGAGHRAMDVAIGLYAFAFGQPDMWKMIERFATGYLSRLQLSADEFEAIPFLVLMREATSLIHWTGRSLQGLTSARDLERRGHVLLEVAEWLAGHGDRLTTTLAEIASRTQERAASGGEPQEGRESSVMERSFGLEPSCRGRDWTTR